MYTSEQSLALALRFGVITELEMQGMHTRANRVHIGENDGVADVRSAGFGITPQEAVSFIPALVEGGSDYIKFMVDDGSVQGRAGLPMLDEAALKAGWSRPIATAYSPSPTP